MTGHNLRIGHYHGAPIYLKPSWFLFTALIIGGYGTYLTHWDNLTTIQAYTAATILSAVLALSVLIHELAHATTGKARGLTPHSIHLTIWGGTTRLNRQGTPTTAILVALAGPLTNLILAAACYLTWQLTTSPWTLGLALSAYLNLAIGLFNLLPAYPLDGGHALTALLTTLLKNPRTATTAVSYTGLTLAATLLATGIYLYRQHQPLTAITAIAAATMLYTSSRDHLRLLKHLTPEDATNPRI